MITSETILVTCLVIFVIVYAWDKVRPARAPEGQFAGGPSHAAQPTDEIANRKIYEIAAQLDDFFSIVAHPDELAANPLFTNGVEYLCLADVSRDEVVRFALGEHPLVACMAMEAFQQRADHADSTNNWREILFLIDSLAPYPQHFALKYLGNIAPKDQALIGPILGSTVHYLSFAISRSSLANFIRQRNKLGEALKFSEGDLEHLSYEGVQLLKHFLSRLESNLSTPLLSSIEELPVSEGTTPPVAATDPHNSNFSLIEVGRFWEPMEADIVKSLFQDSNIKKTVSDLKALLTADRPQSILLVGEAGVGKTEIQRILAHQLVSKKWAVFIAGHSDLMAGQMFFGQFEKQLKQLIGQLQENKKIIWHIPDIDQLIFTGTHLHSQFSALDAILPAIGNGSLRIMAEIQPSAYDQLLQRLPQIASIMAIRRIEPASREQTTGTAEKWLKATGLVSSRELLSETWDLARQYLGSHAAPGNVLDLLKATHLRLSGGAKRDSKVIQVDDVIETLAQRTGMPVEILDTKRDLDLDDLGEALRSRVIGQDEAIGCLVDCVAMIKAALLDPTRPYGVFLFAGPTGTGKTEIAKTLATWLFGSENRLIRLDMSELQDAGGLDRLIGSLENEKTEFLADQVRKQPFTVILLDEFEKSHPNVWDLFLQMFDDARITDRRGRTTFFRNAIIILTANLGSTIPTGASIGFASSNTGFDESEVRTAVDKAFRREFINRLDRVVVFHPLTRQIMRQILLRQLEEFFERRGLKGRPWAVEWDESAIEFLLDKGFTHDLGARPLRRAIERYLLAPLADTIVRHRFPEGDQFLFISRSGNRLRVEFVDPELDGPTTEGVPESVSQVASMEVESRAEQPRSILLQPLGTKTELAVLGDCLGDIEKEIQSDEWSQRRQELFASMGAPNFWNLPGRHEILVELEAIDRVEKGLKRAQGLNQRLVGLKSRQKPLRRLISILAQNLYLLTVACQDILNGTPQEAFLVVAVNKAATANAAEHLKFANQIADMYEAWADKRNMAFVCLQRTSLRDGSTMSAIYSVSGYGAYSILKPEIGRHILEIPGDTPKAKKRLSVQVTVVPQPNEPLPPDPELSARKIDQILRKAPTTNSTIVRRYCEKPASLVRDSKRGWRTGRIDLVLGGDFDLL